MPRKRQRNRLAITASAETNKRAGPATAAKSTAQSRLISNLTIYFETVPQDMQLMAQSQDQANAQRAVKTIETRKTKFGNKAHSPEEIAARSK